jgi:hypothetical protein
MGVEPLALLDHALRWEDLVRLPQLLEAEWQNSDSPLRVLPPPVDPTGFSWRWKLDPAFSSASEQLFDQGDVRFESPSGLSGAVLRDAIVLSPFATWWAFLCKRETRSAVVGACERVGALVRATTVIYIPDNAHSCSAAGDMLYDEGATVRDVVSWLRKECGPPAGRAEDIFREDGDSWSGDGYLLTVLGAAGEQGAAADEARPHQDPGGLRS